MEFIPENLNMPEAVAYLRVSSPKQAQQGESIAEQEKRCVITAKIKGLKIMPDGKVFTDVFSGRKNSRPAYEELITYIKGRRGAVKYCIIRGIDRFTRGGASAYEIMKNQLENLGVELIDSDGIIQPKQNSLESYGLEYPWSKYSPSKGSELMEAHRGERAVADILTRLIGTEITLVRQGYKVRQADDGFVNEKIYVEGKKKVIQIPDPARAKFFIKIFEMSATHTDQEVVDYVNTMGYRSRVQKRWSKSRDRIIGERGNIQLTVKQLQSIRQRPIYCGINTETWLKEPIRTQYKGLVSIATFNKANRGKIFIQEKKDGSISILKDHNPHQLKRMKNNPDFPHKAVILCPLCGKPFLGSSSKSKSGKKVPAYHCTREHIRYAINKNEFDKQLTAFISKLEYKDEAFIKSFEATLINKYREKEKELGEFSVQASFTVTELRAEKNKNIEAFTSTKSEILRAELERKIEELHNQIENAQEQRNGIEIAENDIHAFTRYVKNLMEHPVEMLIEQSNLTALKGLFGLVFEELPTYEDILNGTPKMSLAYNLSSEFVSAKARTVTPPGIEPGLTA